MRLLMQILIVLSSLLILMVCKGNFSDRMNPKAGKASSANTESINGKPDKLSEEPVGLPGYPLVCRWQNVPTKSKPVANLRCFLADKSGEPTDLGALWTVENLTREVEVIQKVIGLEFHVSISGTTDVIVLDALRTLQVNVKYGPANAQEQKAAIADLLKAPNNAYRLASTCGAEFVSIISREKDSIFLGSAFPGCEALAAALNNRALPDLRDNPARLASCEGSVFRFDPVEGGLPEVIEADLLIRESCLQLEVFINSKGKDTLLP